jgi:broad specificity phosphatase PhoE
MMAAGASADTGSFRHTVIYLVRHGQTPLNEADVLRGLADPALDETGRGQAERLGAALGSRELVAVVSSRETAQPVAERAGLEVTVDQSLLDRDYGPWTGVSQESVIERWGLAGPDRDRSPLDLLFGVRRSARRLLRRRGPAPWWLFTRAVHVVMGRLAPARLRFWGHYHVAVARCRAAVPDPVP